MFFKDFFFGMKHASFTTIASITSGFVKEYLPITQHAAGKEEYRGKRESSYFLNYVLSKSSLNFKVQFHVTTKSKSPNQ